MKLHKFTSRVTLVVALAALLVALATTWAARGGSDPRIELARDRTPGLQATAAAVGSVRAFGPVRLGDVEGRQVASIGPFGFRGYCANEGDYGHASLSLRSEVGHAAYVATDADGTLRESSDMAAGRRYNALSFQSDPAGREIQTLSGMAVTPRGVTVQFHIYVAVNTLRAFGKCVYGGTAIVGG